MIWKNTSPRDGIFRIFTEVVKVVSQLVLKIHDEVITEGPLEGYLIYYVPLWRCVLDDVPTLRRKAEGFKRVGHVPKLRREFSYITYSVRE